MHVESDIRFLCSPEADGAGTLSPGAGRAAGPVSRVYEQYETGRKPAPARENLDKLTLELHLSKEEQELLLDLAARPETMRVSADLPEYIMERDIVRAALRTAKEVDATDEEWQEFIDRITKRTPSSRRDGP